MRIDAHTHYNNWKSPHDFDELAKKEPYLALIVTPNEVERMSKGAASEERMVKDMGLAGLDMVVLLDFYNQHHETCVERNNQYMAIARRFPGRFIPFASLQPKAGAKALEELKRCVDGGMRGVGELLPDAQGYRTDDPDFLRLVEACISYNIPLNLHTNGPAGSHYLGKSTVPLSHYYHLACRYPEAKFILAHWGGGLIFYEINSKVRRVLKNVFYDTSASPLILPTSKIFDVALRCVDHHKILYGSDYPLPIYQNKQDEPDFRPFISKIDRLDLDLQVYEDIMGNNIARLLGFLEDVSFDKIAAESDEMPVWGASETRPIGENGKLSNLASLNDVTAMWPGTRSVFEKFDIAWKDHSVPYWLSILQAACARGMNRDKQDQLMEELNHVIASHE